MLYGLTHNTLLILMDAFKASYVCICLFPCLCIVNLVIVIICFCYIFIHCVYVFIDDKYYFLFSHLFIISVCIDFFSKELEQISAKAGRVLGQ